MRGCPELLNYDFFCCCPSIEPVYINFFLNEKEKITHVCGRVACVHEYRCPLSSGEGFGCELPEMDAGN